MTGNETAHRAIDYLTRQLMARYNQDGFWQSQLSSSALSTAVASFALFLVDKVKYDQQITRGHAWLIDNQNADGGWGDTPESPSNLSTTLLAYSSLSASGKPACKKAIEQALGWICNHVGADESTQIMSAVLAKYGDDRTFSVPILTLCNLAGVFDCNAKTPWQLIPQLPFELAVFPHAFFKFLNLSVVSYAIPALIAIGMVRHKMYPSRNPFRCGIRNLFEKRLLNVLQAKQPENGGFLEAAPLTGFVTMSLAACDLKEHPVLKKGVSFLLNSIREDGSWPIDTNINSWVTSLATNALFASNLKPAVQDKQEQICRWLLDRQYQTVHPFTQALPGGWGWSQLAGSVPDGDDTSGALVALHKLDNQCPKVRKAAWDGITWLLQLQNSDGGIPTFCRGWGQLPFDKSCPDITAHAYSALACWTSVLPKQQQWTLAGNFMEKMLHYLCKTQHRDGYWLPLWFGNQQTTNHENPVYGTGRVVYYLKRAKAILPALANEQLKQAIIAGENWLKSAQNDDNGWGGNKDATSTIEETGVAVSALKSYDGSQHDPAVIAGRDWLCRRIARFADQNQELPSSPIGLYFASLWYDEKMYPLVFALDALSEPDTSNAESC